MSYTLYVANKLQAHLNNFINIYGDALDEDRVHEHASEYVTQDMPFFIKTLDELANCITDTNVVDAIESRMCDNNYDNLLFLADDAFGNLAWEYIIENY